VNTLKRFSKRAQQRDAVVKEMEEKFGRKLSNDEISHAVHQSRAKKIKGISTAEVRERQLSQLSPEERQSLETLRVSAHSTRLPRIALAENQALNHAVASCLRAQIGRAGTRIVERGIVASPGCRGFEPLERGGEAFGGFG
jgi:hypothetical protein